MGKLELFKIWEERCKQQRFALATGRDQRLSIKIDGVWPTITDYPESFEQATRLSDDNCIFWTYCSLGTYKKTFNDRLNQSIERGNSILEFIEQENSAIEDLDKRFLVPDSIERLENQSQKKLEFLHRQKVKLTEALILEQRKEFKGMVHLELEQVYTLLLETIDIIDVLRERNEIPMQKNKHLLLAYIMQCHPDNAKKLFNMSYDRKKYLTENKDPKLKEIISELKRLPKT